MNLLDVMTTDVLNFHYRVGDLKGKPDFNATLDIFMNGVLDVVNDLHRSGIYDFHVKVKDPNTVIFMFMNDKDALYFRFRHM